MKLAFWRRATTGEQEKIARSAAATDDVPSGRSALLKIFRRGGDESDWAALEEHLLSTDTGSTTARALIAAMREQGGDVMSLRRAAIELLQLSPTEEAAALSEPGIILLVGVNGAGKTTSAAKLAARARAAGGSPLLVAADT